MTQSHRDAHLSLGDILKHIGGRRNAQAQRVKRQIQVAAGEFGGGESVRGRQIVVKNKTARSVMRVIDGRAALGGGVNESVAVAVGENDVGRAGVREGDLAVGRHLHRLAAEAAGDREFAGRGRSRRIRGDGQRARVVIGDRHGRRRRRTDREGRAVFRRESDGEGLVLFNDVVADYRNRERQRCIVRCRHGDRGDSRVVARFGRRSRRDSHARGRIHDHSLVKRQSERHRAGRLADALRHIAGDKLQHGFGPDRQAQVAAGKFRVREAVLGGEGVRERKRLRRAVRVGNIDRALGAVDESVAVAVGEDEIRRRRGIREGQTAVGRDLNVGVERSRQHEGNVDHRRGRSRRHREGRGVVVGYRHRRRGGRAERVVRAGRQRDGESLVRFDKGVVDDGHGQGAGGHSRRHGEGARVKGAADVVRPGGVRDARRERVVQSRRARRGAVEREGDGRRRALRRVESRRVHRDLGRGVVLGDRDGRGRGRAARRDARLRGRYGHREGLGFLKEVVVGDVDGDRLGRGSRRYREGRVQRGGVVRAGGRRAVGR